MPGETYNSGGGGAEGRPQGIVDDDRHKREQAELRAKRKAAAQNKSESQLEKERRRKQHIQATLAKQRAAAAASGSSSVGGRSTSSKHGSSAPSSSGKKKAAEAAAATKNPSKFMALFEKRAEGFLVDLKFRNNPPRPPVGPTFVAGNSTGEFDHQASGSTSSNKEEHRPNVDPGAGFGVEGALVNMFSRYIPNNAIEQNYQWKLHCEPDLGVGLHKFAMDWKGCYRVPKRAKLLKDYEEQVAQAKRKMAADKASGKGGVVTDEEDAIDGDLRHKKSKGKGSASSASLPKIPRELELHPDDYELLNWTGHKGDSAAEQLKARRERERAMAQLQSQGLDADAIQQTLANSGARRDEIQLKQEGTKTGFKSRVLKEDLQFFMKKTTYLTNDQYRSVHQFKSLADTKRAQEEETLQKLEQLKRESQDPSSIPKTFEDAKKIVKGMRHPTKKGVTAISSYPLLPSEETWGYQFTQVVLDTLPKPLEDRPAPTKRRLERAYISDVEEVAEGRSNKMVCKLLIPVDEQEGGKNEKEEDTDDAETKKKKNKFEVAQQYDLDVITLKKKKDHESVHQTYVLIIDPSRGVVAYHPLQSRILLSTGRPGQRASTTISKLPLSDEDKAQIEDQKAELKRV